MRIHSIRFRNVLGLEEFELDCNGSIQIVAGKNATGKSSVIKGVQTLVGGGNLATLRNNDAPEDEPAEGVLVLAAEDGQKTEIRKRDNRLKVRRQVGDSAAYDEMKPPQRHLDALFSAAASNPVRFMTCSDKERVDMLLAALPVDFDRADLWREMGLEPGDFQPAPQLPHPLQEIAGIRDVVFSRRTDVNRDEKSSRAACDKIRRSIPAEVPTAESTEADEQQLAELIEERTSRVSQIESDAKSQKKAMVDSVDGMKATLRAELAEMERDLQREMEEKLAKARAEADAELAEAQAALQVETEKVDHHREERLAAADQLTEEIDGLRTKVATMHERLENVAAIRAQAELADSHEADADALKNKSDELTGSIERLDAFKAELIQNLPIPGVDIQGKAITVDGVPWSQVNTARQIDVAVAVACLRFDADTDFRPVFIDNAEALDSSNLELLCKRLDAAGANALIGRVEDHDFETRTWTGDANE